MPKVLEFLKLTPLAKPLTWQEGLKILERDGFRCQYCGLDGAANFDHSLIMSVDFVIPRAHKGKKTAENLVAACRPCNTIKGNHVFKDVEEAKAYVLRRREEMRKEWEESSARFRTGVATA